MQILGDVDPQGDDPSSEEITEGSTAIWEGYQVYVEIIDGTEALVRVTAIADGEGSKEIGDEMTVEPSDLQPITQKPPIAEPAQPPATETAELPEAPEEPPVEPLSEVEVLPEEPKPKFHPGDTVNFTSHLDTDPPGPYTIESVDNKNGTAKLRVPGQKELLDASLHYLEIAPDAEVLPTDAANVTGEPSVEAAPKRSAWEMRFDDQVEPEAEPEFYPGDTVDYIIRRDDDLPGPYTIIGIDREARTATLIVPDQTEPLQHVSLNYLKVAPEAPEPRLAATRRPFEPTLPPPSRGHRDLGTDGDPASEESFLGRHRRERENLRREPPPVYPADTHEDLPPIEPPPSQTIRAGDKVQWTSGGVDQFRKPCKVESIQALGGVLYATLKGHATGVPVSELSIVEEAAPKVARKKGKKKGKKGTMLERAVANVTKMAERLTSKEMKKAERRVKHKLDPSKLRKYGPFAATAVVALSVGAWLNSGGEDTEKVKPEPVTQGPVAGKAGRQTGPVAKQGGGGGQVAPVVPTGGGQGGGQAKTDVTTFNSLASMRKVDGSIRLVGATEYLIALDEKGLKFYLDRAANLDPTLGWERFPVTDPKLDDNTTMVVDVSLPPGVVKKALEAVDLDKKALRKKGQTLSITYTLLSSGGNAVLDRDFLGDGVISTSDGVVQTGDMGVVSTQELE